MRTSSPWSAGFSDTGSIDNSDRNRTETTVTTRLGYELVPGTTVFVEPQVNWRSFERGIDAEGDRQGSNGHQVLVGSTWDLTGVMFAELGIGYMRQDFDEARFAAVSGPSFSGTLIWNPDDALSITATVRRAIEETRRIDASGVLVTDTGLRLDYELRDNLIASLDTSYVRSQIEGTGRLDNLYGVKLEIAYLFGPHVWLTGSLKRTRRNSNEPGFDYDNSTVLVTLSLRE